MLGKLSWKEKSHCSLNLAGRKGRLLCVSRQAGSFQSKSLKDIVNEGVEDGHSLLGDASVWVHLLQNFIDVRGVRLHLLGVLFASCLLRGLCCFLSCCWCLCHDAFGDVDEN